MNYISSRGIYKKAWATVKAHFGTIVGATLVLFIIQAILDIFINFDKDIEATPDVFLNAIAASILSLLIPVITTVALVRIARGAHITMDVLTVTFLKVCRYVGVIIVTGITTFIATIVFMLVSAFVTLGMNLEDAGLRILQAVENETIDQGLMAFIGAMFLALIFVVYINMRFMFATYLVVDTETGVFAALKRSWKLSKGNVWTIVKMFLLAIVLCLLGLLAVGAGLFVAMPVVAFAYAYLYVELVDHREKKVVEVKV